MKIALSSSPNPLLMDPTDPRWMDFVQSQCEATIFHHPAWIGLMSKCYGYPSFILAIPKGSRAIKAGLPFMKVNTPFTGQKWVSLPFSDHCNPLYEDDSAREELVGQLVSLVQTGSLKKWEVRWELPQDQEIQKVSGFVLHTIKLDPDPCQVAEQFKRTHLQNIHTAQERGVKIEFGDTPEHLRIFYNLQLETRKRHGVPAQPWKFFELLWNCIVKDRLGFVLLANKDNEYVAGMVYLSWGKYVMAKYAASREDKFNLRANNLLFWEGICWGCRNGYEIFDMGRTELENTGLRTFKNRWGAVEKPLHYSIISTRPHHVSSNKIMNVVQAVIKRSPLWVCRLSGELFYRYFG